MHRHIHEYLTTEAVQELRDENGNWKDGESTVHVHFRPHQPAADCNDQGACNETNEENGEWREGSLLWKQPSYHTSCCSSCCESFPGYSVHDSWKGRHKHAQQRVSVTLPRQ